MHRQKDNIQTSPISLPFNNVRFTTKFKLLRINLIALSELLKRSCPRVRCKISERSRKGRRLKKRRTESIGMTNAKE
jgi:hypothetical protein